jgi:hypothetical protein
VHDFGSSSEGYTAQTQNPNAASRGWAFNQHWVGDGGTETSHAEDYHLLTSPVFPLGSGTNLEFLHLPQFSFNQSGGLLEYRTRNTTSGSFSGWNNVSNLCGDCGTYDDFPFPSNPPSDLSGERVWMSTETNAQLVSIDFPNSLASTNDAIQYRFNFQDPSLVSTGTRSDGPTHWELYSLDYVTSQLLADNIFRVDEDSLDLNACSATLAFETQAPIPVSLLTFEWYESLDDLYDEVSTGDISGANGANVPFQPVNNGVYHYFVRIKYSGTERILPVTVTKTMACTTACLTMNQILTIIRDPSWPFSKHVNDCVEVVNRLCTPQ